MVSAIRLWMVLAMMPAVTAVCEARPAETAKDTVVVVAGDVPTDLAEAVDYCRRTPLLPAEGVWEFPDDETTVWIKRDRSSARHYDVIVLRTPDCRLNAGQKIGRLEETAMPRVYKMSLYGRRVGGIMTDSRQCVAKLKDDDGSMTIDPGKLKISLRNLWFLPRFWRMLRIVYNNPQDNVSPGLIRLYPEAGGSARKPVYL